MRVFARARSLSLVAALLCTACPRETVAPLEQEEPVVARESSGGDPRVDPSRCTGDGLDLLALVEAGSCTISPADAGPLPGPEQLEIEAPDKLTVEAGARLDFELLLRNRSDEPLDLDLAFGRFLPLGPDRTERVGKGAGPDDSCTLRAISTEPPPERISLPPKAVLAVPCQWFANTRLVDPESYVGSECPDFPALKAGRYRSVFTIAGGGESSREIRVEILVR